MQKKLKESLSVDNYQTNQSLATPRFERTVPLRTVSVHTLSVHTVSVHTVSTHTVHLRTCTAQPSHSEQCRCQSVERPCTLHSDEHLTTHEPFVQNIHI